MAIPLMNQRAFRLIQIRERFDHMGDHSGYDQLSVGNYPPFIKLYPVWIAGVPNLLSNRKILLGIHERYMRYTPFYSTLNLWAETRAIKKSVLEKSLIHILYGENNLSLLSYRPFKLNNRLVVTLHQSMDWWESNNLDVARFLSQADAVIVLSKAEKQRLQHLIKCDVHFVPHGVDTEFWEPPTEKALHSRTNRKIGKLLFVGQWQRDFETLLQAWKIIVASGAETELHMVVPQLPEFSDNNRRRMKELAEIPGVYQYSGISSESLRSLYQEASLLFLPLKEATANNSILEALACGLPVVTTNASGVADYLSETCGRTAAIGDAEMLANYCLDLLGDPLAQQSMSRQARIHSERHLSWQSVVEQTMAIYDSVW